MSSLVPGLSSLTCDRKLSGAGLWGTRLSVTATLSCILPGFSTLLAHCLAYYRVSVYSLHTVLHTTGFQYTPCTLSCILPGFSILLAHCLAYYRVSVHSLHTVLHTTRFQYTPCTLSCILPGFSILLAYCPAYYQVSASTVGVGNGSSASIHITLPAGSRE